MLKSIQVKNVALVDELEIEFGEGLNVLTGETGAGKSIIIGSFNFILSARLDKSAIRQGASFARVDAVFVPLGTERNKIQAICGIDINDDTVILSRTIKPDGKGEARINGTVVTTDVLRACGSVLVNIHGQHETEVLLKQKNHVTILDNFGGQRVINVRSDYFNEVDELKRLEKSLSAFGGDDFERKRLIDMYTFQIKDIENAKLRVGEDDELGEKRVCMQNFEKLSLGLKSVSGLFEGDDGICNALRQTISVLGGIASIDNKVEKFYETAKTLKIDMDDLSGDVSDYFENMEFDEDEFKRVDERLDEIKVLKRKYGSTIQDVLNFLDDVRSSLDLITQSEEEIERINIKIKNQTAVVEKLAEELVTVRRTVAGEMQQKIVEELKDLGMPSSKFVVTDIGVNDVTFLFSANAGVEPRPLVHIISGGEMSRFMLALKTVTANIEAVGTLVFDEIDTGISGTMGHKIAEKFQKICRFHQVIAVTHLAQIAAVASNHYLISKSEMNNKTQTRVHKLSEKARQDELTRMVGGKDFVCQLSR